MKPARRGKPCRRFSVLDGMILIAGLAIGVVGGRSGFEEYRWQSPGYAWHRLAGSTLMTATALTLIFRLRRPRPPIRLLATQPGAVACFAILAMQLAEVGESVIESVINEEYGRLSAIDSAAYVALGEFPIASAAVVPVGWLLLLANRRWRPEPGWIDRAGRVLGWAWIAWGLAWPILRWAVVRFHLDGLPRSIM